MSAELARQRSQRAAREIEREAVFRPCAGDGPRPVPRACWELPASLVLGPLLADTTRKVVRLVGTDCQDVWISRRRLLSIRRALPPVRRRHADLRLYVCGESGSVHLRWRGGRGGLDLLREDAPPAGRALELRLDGVALREAV